MSLNVGDTGCTIGLSKRLRDAMIAGIPGASLGDADQLKALCYAISTAVVAEIQANASVSVTVPGTGLTAPAGGGPVTGAASGTGTVA